MILNLKLRISARPNESFHFFIAIFLILKIGEPFINNVYMSLGELMDLLALINNGVNFILYCTMSRAFRKTFQKTFCCNCICLFRPIKKATASRSMQSRTGNQLQNRNSLPSEKLNLLSQKFGQHNDVRLNRKLPANDAIDDDDGLVTINETSLKQNSSTAEAEGENVVDGEEGKRRTGSVQQDAIPECKESNPAELEGGKVNRPSKQRACQSNSVNGSVGKLVNSNSLTKMVNSSSLPKIANGSLSQIVTLSADASHAVRLRRDSGEVDSQADEMDASNPRLKVHRNSSIDSTCNRRKLLHRHNDSRRRYRRKTIANIKADSTGSNCTRTNTSNGCTTKNSSLTTCV